MYSNYVSSRQIFINIKEFLNCYVVNKFLDKDTVERKKVKYKLNKDVKADPKIWVYILEV